MKRKYRRQGHGPQKLETESFFKQSPSTAEPFFSGVQPKLAVSQPGDPQEKQADAMARKVSGGELGKSETSVLRMAGEEEMQAKLQRQESMEEEEMQAKLQRQEAMEEEGLQAKLQRQGEEEEVQAMLFRKEQEGPGEGFETRLQHSRSGGSHLPEAVREEMEQKFGASFKKVRIHTSNQAAGLCRAINAQAFVKGNHIYFNRGKFSPGTEEGKFLLAHELAHVLQQRK